MQFLNQFRNIPMSLILLVLITLAPLNSLADLTLPWEDTFFDGNIDGWTIIADSAEREACWKVQQNALWHVATSYPEKTAEGTHPSFALTGDPSWSNYTLQVRARPFGEDKGYGVAFCYQDENNHYLYVLHKGVNPEESYRRLEKLVDGNRTILWHDAYEDYSLDPDIEETIKVELKAGRIRISNARSPVLDLNDSTFTSGKIALYCVEANKYRFDEVTIAPTEKIADPLFLNGPYLQNVTPYGITIMWETSQPADTLVEYGPTPHYNHSVHLHAKTLFHEFTIGRLHPQKLYHYRVGSNGQFTEDLTFRTAPEPTSPFRFLVYGDNRTDYKMHAAVCNAMLPEKAQLVINVGDVVTNGWRYQEWNREFFIPGRELFKRTPLYVAIGNHERNAHWFYDYFSFPEPENYYSFNYGNTHFIILDTNPYTNYFPGGPQYHWLQKDLQSREAERATWLLAFFHQPPYSNGWDNPAYDGELNVRTTLLPLLEKAKVDICFCGHTHDYERGTLHNLTHVITGGGGAPLDHHEQNFSHLSVYDSSYHYCIVDIDGGTLNFKAKRLDGSLIDSFTLTK